VTRGSAGGGGGVVTLVVVGVLGSRVVVVTRGSSVVVVVGGLVVMLLLVVLVVLAAVPSPKGKDDAPLPFEQAPATTRAARASARTGRRRDAVPSFPSEGDAFIVGLPV